MKYAKKYAGPNAIISQFEIMFFNPSKVWESEAVVNNAKKTLAARQFVQHQPGILYLEVVKRLLLAAKIILLI